MFTIDQKSSSGYQLLDLGKGLYQMRSPVGSFTGSINEVFKYSIQELEFEFKELELGIIEMEKGFYNGAEYGFFKGFMWPFDIEEKNEQGIIH